MIRRFRQAAMVMLVCAGLALIGVLPGERPRCPRLLGGLGLPRPAESFGCAVFRGGSVVSEWAQHYHLYALVVTMVLVLPWLLGQAARLVPRRVLTDPQRLFSATQRRAAAERAGGRCEMDGLLIWTRCGRPGSHGDHWMPWSRGGATTMDNHVWACAPCNLAKGARVPTFWETARIERRRRRYFSPGGDTRPGARFGVPV